MKFTIVAALLSASAANASSILLTEFDFGPTVYDEMETALESDGFTVDRVNARTGGNIANALMSGNYSQVFLYDLTSTRYINQADIDAIAAFWSTRQSLVLDSRSYGLINTTPALKPVEQQLIRNVAAQLDANGGGLWIGTDHNPTWTQNANPVLSKLGFNEVTGSFSQAVNSFDPNSVLLGNITPSDLWAQGASVGQVSLGIQPNGIDMRFHFGHSSPQSGAIPYISASFGNFTAPDEPPRPPQPPVNPIPLPAAAWMLLGGLGALFGVGRKRRSHAA